MLQESEGEGGQKKSKTLVNRGGEAGDPRPPPQQMQMQMPLLKQAAAGKRRRKTGAKRREGKEAPPRKTGMWLSLLVR